ncbi:MAG: Ig-like domain-containing protein, partial [Alphaproteobacteria bacterium]|nr:Ig-like domain-containing protein [Alphaproteobacteria bacterium]
SGTAAATAGVTLYDGTTALGTATADGAGAWSITSTTLASGTYTLTAKATNAADEISGASTGVSITIDTTAPSAPAGLVLAPLSDTGIAGDAITTDASPEVTGTSEAHATVRLFEGMTHIGSATADGTGAWSITASTLTVGLRTLTATATDVAGNTSKASSALTLTIEAPPSSGEDGGPTTGSETTITLDPDDDLSEALGTAGIDTVLLPRSGVLPSKIENATLTSDADLTVTGNGLANVLLGAGGANLLDGKAGDDQVIGGLGTDTILGGPGDDTLVGDFTSLVTAVFTPADYLARNPDLQAAGVDGFRHWLFVGQYEGRSGAVTTPQAGSGLLFDPRGYLQSNPDVAASGLDPLEHFIAFGAGEGRGANSRAQAFDRAYYLATNPDVAAAGVDPLLHFLSTGGGEGRAPSAAFDAAAYLKANPDVAAAGINPLLHYLRFGMAEGRITAAAPQADIFRFEAGSGRDRILDFQPTLDKIALPANVNGTGVSDASALLANAQQVGGDVVIPLGAGNSITLVGVTLASLAPNNILFG